MPQKEVKTIIFKVTVDNEEAKKKNAEFAKEMKAQYKNLASELKALGPTIWESFFEDAKKQTKISYSGLIDATKATFGTIADIGSAAFGVIVSAVDGVKDAFVSVAKESISLEDAMNGVKRTGGLTTDQIAELTSKVRDYSVETLHGFVSSEELAKALEIAGQAGIISGDNFEKSADSALKFAGVLTQAAVALDGMSLEESGEKLGRFHLTFSETVDDIDKAASVLNYFGNITNRSAGFVLNLSGRFAENAKMLRLSEGETMALAAALGNLNMESEQSGTAIGRAMKVMRGESAAFAEAFQMDVEKFSSLIKTDASAAIQMFADQMAKLGQTNEGVDIVLQALSDLELTGQGVSTALLGLGGQADNLRQYLADQGREWSNNTSLMNEFINSTDRTSQLWTALQNIWTNTTGLIGDQLLPVFRAFLTNVNEQAAAFRQWFQDSGFVETVLAPALTEINALLLSGVNYISDFVAGWAKTVDIDAVMLSLKEKFFALIEAFKNIDWAAKFEAVKTALSGVWEVLKNLDWAQIRTSVMGIVDSIQQLSGFIVEFIQFSINAKDTWNDFGVIFSGIAETIGSAFEQIRAISEGFFQMFTDKIYGVSDDMATKFPDAVEQMVKGTFDLVASLVDDTVHAIAEGAVGLMEGLASKVTGFFSNMVGGSNNAVQGVDALKQSIDATTQSTTQAEYAATGGSWLPDLVSWTDKARNDVAGLTSAINQSATAAVQASAKIAEAQGQAAAVIQGQAVSAMGLQELIAIAQGKKEAPKTGQEAIIASPKSGIKEIAPGVWSNIARELGKQSQVSVSTDLRTGSEGQKVLMGAASLAQQVQSAVKPTPGVTINYNGMNMVDESSQRRMVAQISNVQKSASSRLVTTR